MRACMCACVWLVVGLCPSVGVQLLLRPSFGLCPAGTCICTSCTSAATMDFLPALFLWSAFQFEIPMESVVACDIDERRPTRFIIVFHNPPDWKEWKEQTYEAKTGEQARKYKECIPVPRVSTPLPRLLLCGVSETTTVLKERIVAVRPCTFKLCARSTVS